MNVVVLDRSAPTINFDTDNQGEKDVVIEYVYGDKVVVEVVKASRETAQVDFRIVKGPTHVNIVFDAVINPNTSKSEQEIKNNLEEIVTSVDSKFVPVLTLDRDFSTLD